MHIYTFILYYYICCLPFIIIIYYLLLKPLYHSGVLVYKALNNLTPFITEMIQMIVIFAECQL